MTDEYTQAAAIYLNQWCQTWFGVGEFVLGHRYDVGILQHEGFDTDTADPWEETFAYFDNGVLEAVATFRQSLGHDVEPVRTGTELLITFGGPTVRITVPVDIRRPITLTHSDLGRAERRDAGVVELFASILTIEVEA